MTRTASASPPQFLPSRLHWSLAIAIGSAAIICFSFFVGCNSNSEVAETTDNLSSEAQVTPAEKKTTTSSVAPTKTEVAKSPAADALPDADAEPADICQRFMELLKSGNRIAAENLLTRAALTMTSKAGLQLEPMGGPTATYEMKATRFATIEKKLAQVDCDIVEMVDGEELRTPLTWLVRKQKRGWRISGLLLSLETDEPRDLLSFENIRDVEKIKTMAAGEILDQEETRQAAAKSDENKLK